MDKLQAINYSVPFEQVQDRGMLPIVAVDHVMDEDGFIEPRRDLLDAVQARYGEDFGDLVDFVAWLYLNPGIKDEDKRFDSDFDPQEPSRWDLRAMLVCIGHPDDNPIIQYNIDKLHEIESNTGA